MPSGYRDMEWPQKFRDKGKNSHGRNRPEARYKLAIEVVGLDVRGDLWVEHVRALIAGLKALAEIGGGNIFMDGLQQMNAVSLMWRQAQRREVRKRKARTTHHDPLRNFQQPFRLVPTRKIEEAVRADEVEKSRIGHCLM